MMEFGFAKTLPCSFCLGCGRRSRNDSAVPLSPWGLSCKLCLRRRPKAHGFGSSLWIVPVCYSPMGGLLSVYAPDSPNDLLFACLACGDFSFRMFLLFSPLFLPSLFLILDTSSACVSCPSACYIFPRRPVRLFLSLFPLGLSLLAIPLFPVPFPSLRNTAAGGAVSVASSLNQNLRM